MPCRRGYGLPRRFAPRNDMQKHAACQHGNDVVPGEFAALFRIRRKYCPPPCPAARRCGLPRRFAPRNDRQKFALCPRLPGGTAGKRSCTRRNASVFSMSLRTSAHTGVAIRIPAGKPSKLVLLQANPYALFRIRPKYCFLLCSAARRCGLPRRFAPRNDRGGTSLHPLTRLCLLHVIANQCAHWCGNPRPRRGTWQVGSTSGKFVALFRICLRHCSLVCAAARRTDCHVASLLAMTCRNMRRVSTAMTWCQANSQHFSVFARSTAFCYALPQGDADCHVPSLLAMTC